MVLKSSVKSSASPTQRYAIPGRTSLQVFISSNNYEANEVIFGTRISSIYILLVVPT